PHNFPGYLAGLGIVACFVFGATDWIYIVLAALTLVSFALSLMRPDEMKIALISVSATVFCVIYVAFLAGFLIGVRMIADTPHTTNLAPKLLTMFFAMVIFTDTGAFYAGRNFGRHKLAPRISPGKTVEGFVGGLIAAIGAGALCKYTFFPEMNLLHAMILGALIGTIGPVGDLSQSMLKRGSRV